MAKDFDKKHYIDFLLFIPARPPLHRPTYEILTQVYQGRSSGSAWLGLATYIQQMERDHDVKVSMVNWGPPGSLDKEFMDLQSRLNREYPPDDGLYPGLPV